MNHLDLIRLCMILEIVPLGDLNPSGIKFSIRSFLISETWKFSVFHPSIVFPPHYHPQRTRINGGSSAPCFLREGPIIPFHITPNKGPLPSLSPPKAPREHNVNVDGAEDDDGESAQHRGDDDGAGGPGIASDHGLGR